jgi:hypothetical protein
VVGRNLARVVGREPGIETHASTFHTAGAPLRSVDPFQMRAHGELALIVSKGGQQV